MTIYLQKTDRGTVRRLSVWVNVGTRKCNAVGCDNPCAVHRITGKQIPKCSKCYNEHNRKRHKIYAENNREKMRESRRIWQKANVLGRKSSNMRIKENRKETI